MRGVVDEGASSSYSETRKSGQSKAFDYLRDAVAVVKEQEGLLLKNVLRSSKNSKESMATAEYVSENQNF